MRRHRELCLDGLCNVPRRFCVWLRYATMNSHDCVTTERKYWQLCFASTQSPDRRRRGRTRSSPNSRRDSIRIIFLVLIFITYTARDVQCIRAWFINPRLHRAVQCNEGWHNDPSNKEIPRGGVDLSFRLAHNLAHKRQYSFAETAVGVCFVS